jgi:hypothetical protein
VYFQNFAIYQIFYCLILLYLITSALQIKYGEPLNKGRRELLSEFNMFYSCSLRLI